MIFAGERLAWICQTESPPPADAFTLKASAGGGDSVWQIHAKRPPANIIFVGAVIQQFSGSPFPEPVPVIVNHIVPIRGTWCRALPELIVEPVRHICRSEERRVGKE